MFPFSSVSMYSKDDCPWCDKAKELLKAKGIVIEWEHKVGRDVTPAQFKTLAEAYNWKPPTVPLIFGKTEDSAWNLIGGYTDLEALINKGTETE